MKLNTLLILSLLALVSSCKKDDDKNDTPPATQTQTQTINLQIDDHTSDAVVFQSGFIFGEEAAVTLGPVSNTFKITHVKFLFGGTGTSVDKDVTLKIYKDVGTVNPGALLFSDVYSLTSSDDTFQEINLTSNAIVLSGGGSIRISLETGLGLPSVATDTDGTIESLGNWIYFNGVWSATYVQGLTGDFIIRAVVEEYI